MVSVPNFDELTEAQQKALDEQNDAISQMRAEEAMERRMGC